MQRNLFTQDQVCHSNLAEIEIKYSTWVKSSEMEFAINPIDEKIPQIKSQQNLVIRKEHVFSVDF